MKSRSPASRVRVTESHITSRGTQDSAAYESVYYLSSTATMLRVRVSEIGNDIYDQCRVSYSSDDGTTWTPDFPHQVSFQTPSGVIRKGFGTPVVDPSSDKLVVLDTTSLLPSDDMLEALTYTFPTYRVSDDGGLTWLFEDRIVQSGAQFDARHPLQSVVTGSNSVHYSNVAFFDTSGRLVVPVQITRLQADGSLFCPPGALSFHEMMVLIGTWQPDGRMRWEVGDKVVLEPDLSTRGAIEGAVMEAPDGRFHMVMRGSNAGNPGLPGHKWACVSSDGGLTWSRPTPWCYSDGQPFYSPSSYSTILRHSTGRYWWVGNICEANPVGNGPDCPLLIGEVDPRDATLIRGSLTEIDTCRPEDPAPVHLRNFCVYEQRSTRDLLLHMTRLWVDQDRHMRGDAHRYRLGMPVEA